MFLLLWIWRLGMIFKLIRPDKKLFVSIKQTDKKGLVLTAVQTGERKEFSFKTISY